MDTHSTMKSKHYKIETYLSVDESHTSISSWCRRCGGGAAGGAGEMSSLAAAARDTAIISRRKESGVTGSGGTAWAGHGHGWAECGD